MTEAIDGMIDALRTIPRLAVLEDDPPDTTTAFPQIVYYPEFGPLTPWSHGRDGRPQWMGAHSVLFLHQDLPPDEGEGVRRTKLVYQDMVRVLITGFARDKFRGRVFAMTSIDGDGYGWTGQGNNKRFTMGLRVSFQAIETAEMSPNT